MKNLATFKATAETKTKGNFDVTIKIWQESISGQSFKNQLVWKSEVFIYVDGEKMECSDYDRYQPDSIHSFKVCKHFGVPGTFRLRCDSSKVKEYMNRIDAERRAETNAELTEIYESNKRFEALHNA